MDRRRRGVIPMRGGREDQDFSTALTQVASTIYVVCHPVDLRVTLIPVVSSENLPSTTTLGRSNSFKALAPGVCRPVLALRPSC